MNAPELDSKVTATEADGWLVKSFEVPAERPDPSVFKLKGVPQVEGLDFTLEGNVVTWRTAISPYARVEIFDSGDSLSWGWSAVAGEDS